MAWLWRLSNAAAFYGFALLNRTLFLYCRLPGFAVMPMGRYLAGGLQSGSAANLIGVQYKLEALSLEELLGIIIYRFRRI